MVSIERQVEKIIGRIKRFGDKALAEYLLKFDKIRLSPEEFKITNKEILEGVKKTAPNAFEAILVARNNIVDFYKKEKSLLKLDWKKLDKGKTLSQRLIPLERVAVYVPGGKFPYPSTVLMSAIPAKVAGVKKIIMVTPPKKITPEILSAAFLSGVDEIYRVGGPAAIAAVAYGTKRIPKVDKIVGPGNKFVTEAKRKVFGDVGIDMLAGPSEVVIIADSKTNIDFVVNDLLAQLEHDVDAAAWVIYWQRSVENNIKKSVGKDYIKRIRFIKVRNPKEAAVKANIIAPEHLEIMCKNAHNLAKSITSAGAVFLGPFTPVAMGDYIAGPSHVLPTGGSARFSSGLSVTDFYKKINLIEYDKKSFKAESKFASQIAIVEGMKYHAKSIKVRVNNET
ncbi:MAG: histidinol dehydrogenase [bacterium]